MTDFRSRMEDAAIHYKEDALGITKRGTWRRKAYRHILPRDLWDLNLWNGIRDPARIHFVENDIAWHEQRYNLLSSQMLCVNLFFPLRDQHAVLAGFFSPRIPQLAQVGKLDFEYTGDKNYLNEQGGRGRMRTSADLAVEWFDSRGSRGLLLLEFKFTEREFGRCGGATSRGNKDRPRCRRPNEILWSPEKMCYLVRPKNRPYWQIALGEDSPFRPDMLATEPYCPFRYDFYQLMRNQLLAHQIEADRESGFERAMFGVAYHGENEELLRMGRAYGGERNPLAAWRSLLRQPDQFISFTVQDLVSWVDARLPSHLEEWRAFLRAKYDL